MTLKILLNSEKFTPASRVYIYDLKEKFLKSGLKVDINKFNNYSDYDYLFLMGNDEHFQEIRNKNPKIKIVLCDPKQSSKDYIKNVMSANLVLACSNEQRDSFLRLNQKILVYPTYPNIRLSLKKHKKKSAITIGYHGNKVHLEAISENIIKSIENISLTRRINLNLIYNIRNLGVANIKLNKNKNLNINHIQWDNLTFKKEIKKIDIGIVPSLLPIKNIEKTKKKVMVKNLDVNYEPFDYLLRYKSSNNSGRISVFAKYGIPVIAEPTQSNCEVIKNGENGYICFSFDNWRYTLDLLCENHLLRKKISRNLINNIKRIEKDSFKTLLMKLEKFDADSSINPKGYNEAMEDLKRYKYQKNFSLFNKLLIFLSRIKSKIKKY